MEIFINEIFRKEGHLKDIISDYEFRDEQLLMADFIHEMLFESENGLIEAGTGTGKTIAYLIPAVIYSIENQKKITITTETKALQKQLIEKDIPLVKELLKKSFDVDFTYSLCLGSTNYPCRRRFENAVKKGKFAKGDVRTIEIINGFFSMESIFTRFDIMVSGKLWYQICREPEACISFKCPFSQKCPYQLAKKEWIKSDILIMNHYLYFTNIGTGRTYLPETQVTIFDEAHSVENIASNQLGFNLGYNQLLEILERFYHKKKRNHLLQNVHNITLKKKIIELIKKLQAESSMFFEEARSLFTKGMFQLRIREKIHFKNSPSVTIKNLIECMSEAEDEFDDEYIKMEFDIAMGRLFVYSENLSSFVYMNDENFVYWMERSEEQLIGDILLRGQPVNISGIMQKEVFSFFESSVFVSATLSTAGDFSYTAQRLGLESYKSIELKSSFIHKDQMILYIASNISNPNSPSFIEESAAIASDIINYLNGNCLILLTSYRALGLMKEKIRELTDFPVFSQDEYISSEAVEMYIDHHNSILMGTHSFWQGIDLPGDLLRGVIMMRLPFSVPDSPVVQAKMERITEQGLNPFFSYQVPDAVIRFRQGFGRLIRSSNDRGVVAVMDPRISTKSYGKLFLKSVPESEIVYSVNDLMDRFSM